MLVCVLVQNPLLDGQTHGRLEKKLEKVLSFSGAKALVCLRFVSCNDDFFFHGKKELQMFGTYLAY